MGHLATLIVEAPPLNPVILSGHWEPTPLSWPLALRDLHIEGRSLAQKIIDRKAAQ